MAKLIDLSFESINVCVKAIIMLTTTPFDLVVSVSKMVFFVFGIGTRLGSNSLSLSRHQRHGIVSMTLSGAS